MPINRRYPISELLEAIRAYPGQAQPAVTIEYVLLAGINDSDQDMRRLALLLKDLPVKVNLIPYNGTSRANITRRQRSGWWHCARCCALRASILRRAGPKGLTSGLRVGSW